MPPPHRFAFAGLGVRHGFVVGIVAAFFVGCESASQRIVDTTAEPDSRGVEPLPLDLGTRHIGEDWPAFLGPYGDSKSIETGIVLDWNNRPPQIVWQKELGASYGNCTISRGRCFVFDRAGDLRRVRCLNSETGEPLWDYTYPTDYEDLYQYNNGPRCSPVVDGNRVYIFGAEGQLHCLRVTDGTKVWSVDTAERFGVVQNFFGVGSTPVVEGPLLIAMIGGSPLESHQVPRGQLDLVKSNGSGIAAFDKLTGEIRYQITDELASYAGIRLATCGNRRWGFAFARGGLVGFEPAAGKVDFSYPWRSKILESVNASTPVVVGNEVFISETYGPGSSLLTVKPGGYEIVWRDEKKRRHKAMQTHWNTAIHHEGYLYGSSGRHTGDAELRCIKWETGAVQWSEPRLTRCSLMYVDGHFVCQGEYGELRLIAANPDRYEEVGRLQLDDSTVDTGNPLLAYPAWAAPVLSHGLLYVRGNDRLVCLELISAGKNERLP